MSLFYVPSPFDAYDPTWTQGVLLDAAWPVALALVPIALTLRLARHAAALRRFHTAHLTHAQHLTLLNRHRVVRWLTNAATALALVLGGLVVQMGILGAHANSGPIARESLTAPTSPAPLGHQISTGFGAPKRLASRHG